MNADVGKSLVTITYIDSITSAEFNVTYPLEVLSRDTYERYKTLGLIGPEPMIETVTISIAPESEGLDGEAMLEALGITQEEFEAMEEQLGEAGTDLYAGGELQLDDLDGLDLADVEGLEDFGDLDGLLAELDEMLEEFGGASDNYSGGGGSGGSSSTETVLDCRTELYQEE